MKCPGQDKGYWTGDRVFDLPCPRCGSDVEFFRDENARRCSRCGYRFNNARIALDCAAWCDQAELCVGIARPRAAAVGETDNALAGRIIQAVDEELRQTPAEFTRALLVFQHAKELVSATRVNPRVVLPAALLLEIDERDAPDPAPSAGDPVNATAGGSRVTEILSRAGLDGETVHNVSALIASYHGHCNADTMELAVLHDSCRLASLTQEGGARDSQHLESVIAHELQTEAGKAWARNLFGQ